MLALGYFGTGAGRSRSGRTPAVLRPGDNNRENLVTMIVTGRIASLGVLFTALVALMPAWAGTEADAVETVVRGLQTDWNRADMSAYLAAYRQDEDLRLVFGGGSLKGWDSVNSVFREEYPDEDRMGKFTIDALEVRLLSPEVAIANGTFEHVFPHQTVRGAFSHVLQKHGDGRWVIEHEHVSRGEVVAHEGEGG